MGDIPKCENCEEFANKCDCYEDIDIQIILAWKLKHGYLKSDYLTAIVNLDREISEGCEHQVMLKSDNATCTEGEVYNCQNCGSILLLDKRA